MASCTPCAHQCGMCSKVFILSSLQSEEVTQQSQCDVDDKEEGPSGKSLSLSLCVCVCVDWLPLKWHI